LGHAGATVANVLYTAKCYWPGVTEEEVRASVTRASGAADFRGALYLPGDDLVLCLFDVPTRADVKRASEQAGLPCERVIESVWFEAERERRWEG
jgi:hypothetical protein